MVSRNILLTKVEYINRHVLRMRPYRGLRFEHFLRDINAQDIIEYNLFQAINHFIAMMEHIVVDEDYGLPQSAADAAGMLKTKRVFTAKDVELIRKMIGFRNVLGHDYIHLDKKIVYAVTAKLARKFKL
jgi:uncharacterized protein YutE (UPF0331/DUF86 family)